VTIEDRAGEPDIHVHAGGHGVWQSRMVSSLVPVALNVVRHGLGTGGARAVDTIAERVELRAWKP
jgi:1-phosphofructokinase